MDAVLKHLIAILVLAFSSIAYASEPTKMEENVAALNAQALKTLGVSLSALHYLVTADANSFLLLSHLEQSGEINFIRELEAKGYVKTLTTNGLPDGFEKNTKYIRLIPIRDGIELQRCLTALSADRYAPHR